MNKGGGESSSYRDIKSGVNTLNVSHARASDENRRMPIMVKRFSDVVAVSVISHLDFVDHISCDTEGDET